MNIFKSIWDVEYSKQMQNHIKFMNIKLEKMDNHMST